jgi:hypothetical protein
LSAKGEAAERELALLIVDNRTDSAGRPASAAQELAELGRFHLHDRRIESQVELKEPQVLDILDDHFDLQVTAGISLESLRPEAQDSRLGSSVAGPQAP